MIHDPLKINLQRQKTLLLASISPNTIYSEALVNASSSSQLLATLSSFLAVPAYTQLIATLFRPILIDLCARWLESEDASEQYLVALCYLLEVHEELFPILHQLLFNYYLEGPLAFIDASPSPLSINVTHLHQLLLAYYRILQANRELPGQFNWSLKPLSQLIWTPHLDNGIRILAIRCYSLQSGMCEEERSKLETEVLGELCGVDCQLDYGQNLDGTTKIVDGWIMPVIELKRVQEERDLIITKPIDYFSTDDQQHSCLELSDLSPILANVHGVLLLKSSRQTSVDSAFIPTPSSTEALKQLALHVSLRLPILLTSAPSAGKSLLIHHLSKLLHPERQNQIVTIHLADTSLDPRAILGSYVSSTMRPGTFEWKEGVLVRSMREGRWVVFEDVDRGSNEVLGVIKPLVESLSLGKWIGGRATLDVPSRGRVIAHDQFMLFATRSVLPSRNDIFHPPTFFGAHKFHEIVVQSPPLEELCTIVNTKFPRLATATRAIVSLWDSVRSLRPPSSGRVIGTRELEKFCRRIDTLLPVSYQPMDISSDSGKTAKLSEILFPSPSLREDMYLEARDVFFGAGALTASTRTHTQTLSTTIGQHLGLELERQEWVLQGKTPEFEIEKDASGRSVAVCISRTRLPARINKVGILSSPTRPFAMHRPAVLLLSRITTAISHGEPVLLTGETGTGKTSIITHLASLLHCPLISLNLSHQTESSDLIGGLKPVDARIPGSAIQEKFTTLFGTTFSRKKNEKFETEVRKAVNELKWKRAVGLWKESVRLAMERIQAKETGLEKTGRPEDLSKETPRKRRKTEHAESKPTRSAWAALLQEVEEFEVQHVHGKGKFAFGFVEGPLVKALRSGDWVLLDEVNLASAETLECISSLLDGPTASITLTENGSLEPVPRHPDFRLFACMNPATDVGKKDLPPNIRSRFTEIDVPSPDADKDTLLSIITQYIGPNAVGDKGIIMDIAEFYSAVKKLSESRQISDGDNHRPHFSMRTLTRALTFAADTAGAYSLRRSVWEGCLMAFTMVLDTESAQLVTTVARKHLLAGVRNPRSMLIKEPSAPKTGTFVKFGPFYLEKGPLEEDLAEDYILTPSVHQKLIDLARIILTRRFPILIEGPTSSGKTSSIEYLAKRTGHHFVRINNHEHTDIQEYLGSYVSDPLTGKLVFNDGLLVQALREGHWIVLDELNLAPTDVLEALNRLLDDNRELVIPETQEVVRPHPHFMLFATQNPPGLYAGRKILSRAFRSRFLEVHFEDVPQTELETILCQRCQIAPSYGKRIVTVFHELQKRRQTSRVFESKHGFATLRDLFRWAGRDAVGYQELADNGYMLLAERTRRAEDKAVVKEVIESVMGVRIDEDVMYNLNRPDVDMVSFLGHPIPTSKIIWTKAMQRLYTLVCRGLKFNEPILLVGDTGSGKTSVCQVYADASSQSLLTLNCHQNTETADLLGGLRPVRNRATHSGIVREATVTLKEAGIDTISMSFTSENLASTLTSILKSHTEISQQHRVRFEELLNKSLRLQSIFEWHSGPLINAMNRGDIFLLDEISLADDSVLERLNSVLEPGRSIVLAERGGTDSEHSVIRASEDFKLVATMNPGGDYGKKELSPALRNRFTEIWVPPVDDRSDLELIVDGLWQYDSLQSFTMPILDFIDWLCLRVGDRSLLSLRDILAWVLFTNAAYNPEQNKNMPCNEIFHHAAHMTYLDGLSSLPQFTAYSRHALEALKSDALEKLQALVPLAEPLGSFVPAHDPSTSFQLGSFAIPKGTRTPSHWSFNFTAPTTLTNAMRVIRACQVSKPILLEGSPGVGKTSLVTALSNISGHELCRINLSDQTDLIDLFGSDLPVEGGSLGEFAWRDAEFLKALQEGHWVLLDEMNLAPQAVLEGLNAILDHRGTVYIPELNRSFSCHPSFRIFAAQNPLSQGGGRKGLPKSFVNRFSKVYIEELMPSDLYTICQHAFPAIEESALRAMVSFNVQLNEQVSVRHAFAHEGSPWEFNLRDITRWGALLACSGVLQQPQEYLRSVYLHRFRSQHDRQSANSIFNQAFSITCNRLEDAPAWTLSATHIQVGHFTSSRKNKGALSRPRRILKSQLSILESLGDCITQSWLAIVTGQKNCGKTDVVRILAHFTGNQLQEISMNSATDTMDILGSFEQVDNRRRLSALIDQLILHLDFELRSITGSKKIPELRSRSYTLRHLCETFSGPNFQTLIEATMTLISSIIEAGSMFEEQYRAAQDVIHALHTSPGASQFEWVDGPLIKAMKSGHWLLMDGANLCSPSVLDRLNSLCESEGFLVLSERGFVDGRVQLIKPHPNFRLFMSVDPQYGELSRAMRNRGVEIALLITPLSDDHYILLDHYRLPLSLKNLTDPIMEGATFDAARRGLLQVDFSDLNNSSTGRFLDQDSALSSLVDQVPTLLLSSAKKDEHPWIFFLCRSLAPAYMQHLTRYLASCDHTRTISPVLYKFLSSFPDNDLRTALEGFLQSYALHRKVSSAYPLTQPKDFYSIGLSTPDVNLGLELPSLDLMVFEILNLAAALFLLENSATPEKLVVNRSKKYNSELAYTSAVAILDEIQTVGRKVLKMSGTRSSSNLTVTTLASSVLDCGLHLKKAICSASFDFSTVTAVSQWLVEALENCPSLFMELHDRANLLRNLVSPSTGLGLSVIWSTLYIEKLSENAHESVKRTESLSCSLKTSPTSSSLRLQAFNVMCLEMLPISLVSRNATSLSGLKTTLDGCLVANASGQQLEQPCHVNPQSLFVELYALTLCRQNQECQPLSAVLQGLVRLTSHDKNGSLLRIVPYQHLVWACEIGTVSSAIIVRAQMSWLEGLWNSHCKTAKLVGPTLLFASTHLHIVIVACDWNGIQLVSLADHEINIRQQVRMAIFQSKQRRSRVFQLIEVLNITLATIASCFSNSDDQSSYDTVGDTDLSIEEDFHSYWANVLTSLECSRNESFVAAIQEHLRPLLITITGKDTLQSIGACWIALSRFILSLVIPDAPVDPAVVKACSFDRIRNHESSLRIQISLHRELEKLLTGNADNELTRFLKPRLQNVNEQLAKVPNLPNRNDVSRLHLFWSEVSQFQKNIILSKKVEGLLDALLNGNEDAVFRERVTQESLTGFYQRLDSIYPEFADISILLKLAVLYMQIGLRLAVQSTNLSASPSSPSATLVSSLLAFPSVGSCNRIYKDFKAIKSSDTTAISQILLTLAALSLERSLGTDSEHHLNMVDEAYDQAMRLWLIDRAKETGELEASNTLYRHSNLHHEAVTDAEIEEAEFLELFPTYEDSLESDTTHISNGKPRPSRLVQGMDMVLLVDIHHDLILQRSSPPSAVQSRFDALRSRTIELLVTCSPESLPQTLDQTSVHFQISLLHASLSHLDNVQSSMKSPYNFYKDQNIVQLKCAADVLSALKQRLQVISDEWPDQMVLKHLIERCDTILLLRSNTPVAKVLSAIEQLLVHTEDWEMYANRENTIKVHRDGLIRLIVEWRRMELSCWQTLLDSQATMFAEEISEWWFRLYDALIRGSLSAAEQECSGDRSLSHYIETLMPLLDSFVTSSPLGQFAARIELLGSFEKYIATVGAEKAPLERVRRVLHSTHRYYDSFSDRLEKRLIDQKAELEKEIRKFVKLASWKDINVQALKESAQRTHHQLYKIIKKWRNFLRQPVAGHIQPWTAGAPESQPLPMDTLSELHLSVSLPRDTLASEAQSSVTIPSYLLHLERTLQRCDILIEQQLRPCVGSHSAQIVDDIAVEIITTSNELASISIPPKPGALREKQRKGLLVRKRKAWVDMLKELKRMGLASNVKPEILRQNMDQRWIREQPIMPIIPQSEFILRNGETYFVKLSGSLPDLRASLSNHHSDLSTRELHRGRMFLESGFSMAVDLRSRLAIALDLYRRIDRISQRLQQICSSDENVLVGVNLRTHVVSIKDLLCKLSSGLSEVHKNAGILDQLESEGHATDNFLEKLSTVIQTTDLWRDRLTAFSNQIYISVFPALTKEEEILLLDVKTHLLQISTTISSWRDRYPRFRYLILPFQQWLNDQDVVSLLPTNPSLTLDNVSLQPLLDAFLISIQSLISRCPVITDGGASEEPEDYISNGYKFVRDFTHLLGLDKINALIEALLIELSSCTNFRPILTKILPFLEVYLNLVRDQLAVHNNWTKSLFKLVFILCTVMQTLSQQGFCQPPASDDNDEGGEVEVDAAGMGIGDGSGNDDVSKEIEDESQIEGLQGDEVENKEREGKHDNDDAIEMNDDFGGALEDIPDSGSENDMESDADNEPELDETLENLDDLDNAAVDEKMWGDEKGPEDLRNSEDQTNQDHSKKQDDSSEMVGKEDKEQKQAKEKQSEEIEELEGKDELGSEENEGDESKDPNVSGAPMNDQVPDANTLDLPDDINVSGDDVDMSDGSVDDTGMEQDDDGMREEDQPADDATPDAMDDDQVPDNALENRESAGDVNNDETKESEHADDEASREVVAPPDISEGVGMTDSTEPSHNEPSDKNSTGELGTSAAGGQGLVSTLPDHEKAAEDNRPLENVEPAETRAAEGNGSGSTANGLQQGQAPIQNEMQTTPNPLRSLGDAIKEIRHRFEDILSPQQPDAQVENMEESASRSQIQYLQPEDVDHDMQALGPAGEEQTAKLDQLTLIDDETTFNDGRAMDVDMPLPAEEPQRLLSQPPSQLNNSASEQRNDVEAAIMRDTLGQYSETPKDLRETAGQTLKEDEENDDHAVEMQLRSWRVADYPDEGAERIWRSYESLTHDLAYALCEQLRLILEPTLATRLKGDYRTGKRLNMKKVISYIASDYTKDKIWLRRTKPSQREYQVLISIDDSRSMAESHSIHLAYQTLALISKALGRLESGDIAIAKFGETVDLLHGFNEGPFTDQAGTKVMNAFRFQQKATNVLSLLETSLTVLESARERQATNSSSAADLWQLQIIISDGMCQDHDKLRTILRKANEQRVMVVFIILDSLHAAAEPGVGGDGQQGSIISMDKAEFKNVDGKMELQLQKYLDSFPFEYYVVLRNVEALPEVLAGTLKQFFERITDE